MSPRAFDALSLRRRGCALIPLTAAIAFLAAAQSAVLATRALMAAPAHGWRDRAGRSCARRITTALAAVLLTLGVASAASGQALAATWSIQTTPTPTGGGALYGVSCPSSTACLAVGASSSGTTLAEWWNGAAWTIQPTPNPVGATRSVLAGVSCTTVNNCTAVGDYTNSSGTQMTLAERWNGTGWAIQYTPNPGGSSVLSGVSCPTATACTAVGHSNRQALAQQWNGNTWAIVPTPTPGTYRISPSSLLSGVSCTGVTGCTAVGDSAGFICNNGKPSCNCFQLPYCTYRQDTLAERWDGSMWTIQPTRSAGISALFGVSCATVTACTAVGHAPDGTIAASWNGSSWTPAFPQGLTNSSGILSGVSCTTANACIAVGQANHVTLAEMSNPDWWIQPTPNPVGTTNSQLTSVSCRTSTACTAVGYYVNSAGTDLALAEGYHG
jgi:hypothetical protein